MKIIKKNRTKTDCGIVAATNAAAWCNLDKSYEEVEKVARSCGYSKLGIYGFQFCYLIKKLNIPAKRIPVKTITELEKQLYSGKFFIFLYTPSNSRGSGHVISTFVDHTGNIRIINPMGFRRTWRALVSDLNENGVKNFAAWEVPPRELR